MASRSCRAWAIATCRHVDHPRTDPLYSQIVKSILVGVQVQMLHVDAAVGPVSVMSSGAKEPIAAAGQTAVFGKLAVARQVTAAPETYKRRLIVGRCRDVEIEVCLGPTGTQQ